MTRLNSFGWSMIQELQALNMALIEQSGGAPLLNQFQRSDTNKSEYSAISFIARIGQSCC